MSDVEVELVFALADRQVLRTLSVAAGSSICDVLTVSGFQADFPDIDFGELATGIWGREAALSQKIKAGDRIEIYRPLELEPREARRQLALAGRTMSGTDERS
jgi:putative ubiquitin-RnfH superfamily antitoxin RatB of RatAB toxin-antitoxin module